MCPITDTHVHFDAAPPAIAACVQRAVAAGVTRLLAVGGSAALNASASLAARNFPQQVRLALGWDRDQATKLPPGMPFPPTDGLPLAAIGEIGLDYHYHAETQAAQCQLFGEMLREAEVRDLPVCIHTREADADTCRILDEHGSHARRAAGTLGVVHCFTGGQDFARALLDRGLYLSFSGIVTFRNADSLREVARFVPADRLLLETDSPFLTPVPKRGVENEPAFVVHVVDLLAKVRGITRDQLVEQTSMNAERLFGPWPTPTP
jgi:TatD DNase family protein